jgi:hypothetical protein
MNLGPNSQMVINVFPPNDPGIITLVKGQLRSKVTKDYMEMDDKNKSKLFIKTESAAMGIRGTDFQVNYNEENHNTSLITFEGAVAMSHINHSEKELMFDQRQLEHVISGEKAVMVKRGEISAINLNISEMAMVPTKLGMGQIQALKENETGMKVATDTTLNATNKQFRSPIPPGIDGSLLASTPRVTDTDTKGKSENNTAKGFFDQKTGQYKLPAGSIIDLNSVNIIPPPVNAVFDNNSKMFVVPVSFGKIDPSTGEYKAPEGLKLGNDGKFQVVQPKERAPGSENTSIPKKIDPPNIFETRPEMAVFADKFGTVNTPLPPPPQIINDQLQTIANDRINATEIIKNNATNTNVNLPNSKIRMIFNVK